MSNRIRLFFIIVHVFAVEFSFGQQKEHIHPVAITMDDVPSVSSGMLQTLVKVDIPVAIFINEGKIYRDDSLISQQFSLLHDWVKRPNVTLGNHTFSHSRYSRVGYNRFVEDVSSGEWLTKSLAKKYSKKLDYFRFPYNDCGKDSLQQDSMKAFLTEKGYRITPFTFESSDWMFNALYTHYLKAGDNKNTRRIAKTYVEYTVQLFEFFDSLTTSMYDRNIKHIYLCHDNKLNSDYLEELLEQLEAKKCRFISLEDALSDPVYNQEKQYHKKWGESWVYKWVEDKTERKSMMFKEPLLKEITDEYNRIIKL